MPLFPDARLIVVCAGCAGAAIVPLQAALAPEWLGDIGSLHADLSTSVQLVDNVYLTSSAPRSETTVSVTPGVTFELRERADLQGSLALRENFVSYLRGAAEDDQLSSLQANATLTGVRTQFDVDAGFAQTRGNLRDFRSAFDLIRRDRTTAGARGSYRLTEKTSLSSGVAYDQDESAAPGFHSTREFSIPLEVAHELTPKISVSASYRFNRTDVNGPFGSDFRQHAFGGGASGEFTPKLTGHIGVNWSRRLQAAHGAENILGLDGSVTWAAAPRMTCTAVLTRGFRASRETGDSFTNTTVAMQSAYAISVFWSAQAHAGYEIAAYQMGREDRLLNTRISVRYSPSLPVEFSAEYNYEWNRSNAPLAAYEQNSFSVSAAFRY